MAGLLATVMRLIQRVTGQESMVAGRQGEGSAGAGAGQGRTDDGQAEGHGPGVTAPTATSG
jgi:hypothetical protein